MTRIVEIRETILAENRVEASELRRKLSESGTVLVNIMASPGAGKTSLIERTIEALRSRFRITVVEADLDSTVDADRIGNMGIPAIQIETGGFCHVDARMMQAAIRSVDLSEIDLIFLENVGNLICTAQNDPGAHVNAAILSVPEGDDKPLKYPIMFRSVEAVVLNKVDYLALADFDVSAARTRIGVLNSEAAVIPLSCRTGEGIDEWVRWLEARIESVRGTMPR